MHFCCCCLHHLLHRDTGVLFTNGFVLVVFPLSFFRALIGLVVKGTVLLVFFIHVIQVLRRVVVRMVLAGGEICGLFDELGIVLVCRFDNRSFLVELHLFI